MTEVESKPPPRSARRIGNFDPANAEIYDDHFGRYVALYHDLNDHSCTELSAGRSGIVSPDRPPAGPLRGRTPSRHTCGGYR